MAKLFIVPTPIGNLEDLTHRAARVLEEVDIILAEDTRTSARLLAHYSITTPMRSHHMHNEHKTVKKWADEISSGKNIALITDAGTPAISDPGFLLVRECVENQIEVDCLPGATAFVPALVNSGLPCDRFTFEGFLPQKKGRQTRLKALATESKTMIFYESPYRIVKSLQQFGEYMGLDRRVSVSREISKRFEETIRGTLAEVIAHFTEKEPKGEFVIVLEGHR
ncbi:16S rRNA (cytidine(1402)-2'-O)-methyltransferase [Flavobacteriales bacterium]|mgnify:FL=1|jgi:16S rRNA (cytidine1402-2'-O)-methyltransferase|nr:16S rRNA (cytidine(1402)-2'-O)-methyltransferase [Flavobacteriales bacterium]MDB2361838.1 16S rRNA (cytidine(1402)-2'-O)-methyltransferase [Flavobacteriales bacterium]